MWASLESRMPFVANKRVSPRRLPDSELVKQSRAFWYSNSTDGLDLNGELISRGDMFVHGGPDRSMRCVECQQMEWLSRIRRQNLFQEHECPDSDRVRQLCSYQESDLWTHLHQNFNFAIGCDPELPAPKCICMAPDHPVGAYPYRRLQHRRLDPWALVWQRKLAYACQVDIVKSPTGVRWKDYDLALVFHQGEIPRFRRPDLPVILYGHDFWGRGDYYQWVIDWLRPDALLTPYPGEWGKRFRLPNTTRIIFNPFFDSLFFARPNLAEKELDLLVLGPIDRPIYEGRKRLDRQIRNLPDDYKIDFNYLFGTDIVTQEGPCILQRDGGIPVRALNKWSEYLGSARYSVFGRMKYDILVSKYFEVLGSGTIPILPEVPDLQYLGLEPMKHYVPLTEIEGRNDRLTHFLDNYDQYKYLAENVVRWYTETSDRMVFEDFEKVIHEMTHNAYPKRSV